MRGGGNQKKESIGEKEKRGERWGGGGTLNTKSPGDVVKIFYTNADSIVNEINLLKAHVSRFNRYYRILDS